jgi:hypothetical protein
LATLAVVAVGPVAAIGLGVAGAGVARAASAPPIGAHSMLQLNSPYPFMDSMFAQAAAMHAASIRLDVAPALMFTDPGRPPDFSGLDEVMSLSQRYALPVVADLFTVPPWLADCAAPTAGPAVSRCATTDLTGYAAMIGQIVAHAAPVIHDWEVWNEPDNSQFFTGTPQQYAWMLRTAHDAIVAADSEAVVLLGGMSSTAAMPWLAAVLATPGADAVHAFAIATVHERGWLTSLAGDVTAWRRFLAAYGFTGPLWVTEHGYPSDPGYQYDPAYAGGAASQAAFLTASIPTLLDAGAAEVFVTERDNLSGEFASEGVLGGAVSDLDAAAPVITTKPSFAAVQAIADCYAAQGRDCPSSAPAPSPAALGLPGTHLGTSTSRTVTVSDPGPAPLVLAPAALIPRAGGGLSIRRDTCWGRILEPDQRCSLAVRFAPVVGGAVAATLQLNSDNGTLTVPIAAAAPSVSSLVAPPASARAFVAGAAGDGVGAPQRLTLALANPLAIAVHIAGWALSGPDRRRFTLGDDRCARSILAPHAGCRLTVTFTPGRVGAAAAVLSLRGDGSPLLVALNAVAFAAPSVKRVIAAGGLACLHRTGIRRVEALTDQPTALTWQVRRTGDAVGGRCTTRPGGAPVSLGQTAAGGGHNTPAGRRWARGHARTAGRPLAARGVDAHRYVARFMLPLAPGRDGLASGRYRLTLLAGNAHGTGRPDALTITVLP